MNSVLKNFILLAFVGYVHAQADPVRDNAQALPQAGNKISSIPKSISYELVDGSHVYTIKGIYDASLQRDIKDPGSLLVNLIPDCEECNFNFEKRTCTIQMKRKLTNTELASVIDDLAKRGGDMPYWAELKARDLPANEADANFDFVVEEFNGDFPKHLAWFSLSRDKEFVTPFAIGQLLHFKVLIVPTTAYSMRYSRYCIRILNAEGKVVWSDTKTAFADISIAISAMDNGSGHALLIRRHDYGKDAKFTIKRKSE